MIAMTQSKYRRRFAADPRGLPRGLLIVAMMSLPAVPAVAHSPIGEIDDVVVLKAGLGAEQEGCARFRPTAREVRGFFERSIVISGRQQHDFFDHGPCSARGTLRTELGDWAWEMRNLGTGELRSITDEVFIVGDPSQRAPREADE